MKKFQRTKEDFICEHCGAEVVGSGYTNHCPKCLWSKHVDINPGDRAATCGGLMRPKSVETKEGGYVIVQECQKCGFVRKNKFQKEDDFDVLLLLK